MVSKKVFREATLRICSSLDFPTALKSCFDYLETVLPLHGIYIMCLGNNDQVARCVATHSRSHGSRQNVTIPLSPVAIDFAQGCVESDTINPVVRSYSADSDLPIIKLEGPILGYEHCAILVQSLVLEKDYRATLIIAAPKGKRFMPHHHDVFSCLNKPFSIAVSNVLAYDEMVHLKEQVAADNRELAQELHRRQDQPVIGEYSGLRHVMGMVRQVASLPSTVLLLGETGVGKEVLAQAIHHSSSRASGPFIKVNCGAITETLIDSELFGHEKGAFTGAVAEKKGRFERAHGGTIFLDEIGELPPSAQVRLLRVLQERKLERVGGDRTIAIDIRVIAATHCNLDSMVVEGLFREDLLFRLNAFPVTIPPLRHRKEDIPLFVQYFLKKKQQELGRLNVGPVLPETLKALCNYRWPGNVRELENAIERTLIQSQGSESLFDDFNPDEVSESRSLAGELLYSRCVFPCLGAYASCSVTTQQQSILPMDEMLRHHIQQALQQCDGQVHGKAGAAQLLEINPNTLRSKMAKLGISFKSA